MKTLKFLLFAVLALSMGMACSGNDMPGTDNSDDEMESSPIIGQWKIIEENDAWDYDLIRPVDYYRVWEFFPDGTVKHYYNSDNVDEGTLKTYELKSDSLYIYYDKDRLIENGGKRIYICRFIDEEKNKIKIEYLQGILTDIMQPLVWIHERVNK